MKYVFLLIGLAAFAFPGFPQQPKNSKSKDTAVQTKPAAAKKKTAAPVTAKKPGPKPQPKKDEKTELEKALAIEDAAKRVPALEKFLADFPKSESRDPAIESLTNSRVTAAEAKFDAGEREAALKLIRKAIEDAPTSFREKLFAESISKVPSLLLAKGEAAAAYEFAALIEKNSSSNAPQLISLAGFYLSVENGPEAKRLAEAAIKIDEKSSAGYQTLGMANRLSFDLEASAAAYEKAVEIDPGSVSARQSLAEMKRALGKTDEAIAMFSSLIERDPNDTRSQNGRILSLFDAGKRVEAEAEFARAVEANPENLVLIAGASYWYAAQNENSKAIDFAGKAIAIEPRYIWSHIALARGLTGEGRYLDAEQVLLKARQYGNFPSLDYEIASVKYAAGFYREAADELQRSFSVKEGNLTAKLGRRIDRNEKNFIDLLASERRASILEPKAADSPETADKLKTLLEFRTVMAEKTPDEAKVVDAAVGFTSGTDKMRFHRQVFAANELLERSLAPAKVLELAKAAISSVDDGLNVSLPAAPIMASELYASRTAAFAADKYVLVPDIPKQTLSAIARGRIEDIAGAALIQQKNNAEAAIRLKRAVSILPEKSAWWRTSLWRLATVLEADGKDKEALETYVKSYTSTEPEAAKFAVIEGVYKRINNGTDGLEALIGPDPSKPVEAKTETSSSAAVETKTEAPAETKADAAVETKMQPQSEKKLETAAEKPSDPAASTPTIDAKALVSPSPLPEPEIKKPAEQKPTEPKAAPGEETLPKPTEPVQKGDDAKPNPVDQPSPKPIETIQKPEDKKSITAETIQKSDDNKPKPTEETAVKPSQTDQEPAVEKAPETKPSPKPLFEPVVIEIKSSKPETGAGSGEPQEDSRSKKQDEKSGAARPRMVEGKEIGGDVHPPCTLSVSQDNISIIGGGGSVGVLVGAENGDIKKIKAVSSSPKDVEVVAEPEIAGVSDRALFVIRSLTSAAGVFQVAFTSPCGTKEVVVKVR